MIHTYPARTRVKPTTSFTLALICAAALAPFTASAAYYNTYSVVHNPINNANGCYSAQGFQAGGTYAYTAKTDSSDSKAVIYRTKRSDGSTTLMTNGDNGTTYMTYLGHPNDLTLSGEGGNYYIYAITMQTGSYSLVKLQYSGTTYYKVGNFTLKFNGSNISMSAIKKVGSDTNNVYFIFKKGLHCYWGSVSKTASSGTINLTDGFTLNIVDALVNGSTVSDITSYSNQGIGYSSSNDRIFVPLTKDNVSIVLVYDNVISASGEITSNPNLSFRITSGAYPDLFEIESCSVQDGKLYFSTNRRTVPGDTAHDAVCYFNGYTD